MRCRCRRRRGGARNVIGVKVSIVICSALALLFARGAHAFKAQDFKTCATSSFCARTREAYANGSRGEGVVVGEDAFVVGGGRETRARVVDVDPHAVRLELFSTRDDVFVRGVIEAYASGAVRVRVDEHDDATSRYVPADVLTPDVASGASRVRLDVVSRTNIALELRATMATAIGGGFVRVVVTLVPFKVDVYYGESDAPSASMNARGGFVFEKRHHAANGETFEETFNGHKDTRKNGPMAVAFDVTFPTASDVYGIPERATTLSLKPTRAYDESQSKGWFGLGGGGGNPATESKNGGVRNETTISEPYRLYNLDVFEYVEESAFGLYGSIPMMTAHGFSGGKPKTSGIYFHNPSEMYVDVNTDGPNGVHTRWMAESGAMDVFVLPGNSPAAVMRQYSSLTGTTSMPPMFSLGYHQCRWNYRDENDVKEVDQGFDEHDIPYDVLWLDIEHTDGKRYMTWDKSVFPTPERMINDIASRGRKMVTIVDPHVKIDDRSPVYKEAKDKGFYVKKNDGVTDFDGWCWPGSSTYLDVTNPQVREWWANKFSLKSYKGSTKDLYIWNDMNEPSVFNGPEITMQKDLVHHGGVEHREVHNAFGMYYHMATAEGIKRRNDNKRPFVLSRAFFAGTQRIGPIWTGDNTADWNHLAVSLPMVLTLGVSGLTFSGADVGGFFGNPDAQLMTRWYQVGTYYPFFRGHAHLETKRREPWLFGEESTAIIRTAIRERYALLPYMYTLFEESHRTGAPVLRPLWYEFPEDALAFKLQQSFMLGSSILVQPVLIQDATSVEVYLPNGVWYSQSTGARVVGAKTIVEPVTMKDVPVYIRGGSIFVRKDRARRSTAAMKGDPLTVIVALDENGEAYGTYYADDGESYEYASNDSAYMRRSISFKNGALTVRAASDAEGGAGNAKTFVDDSLIERITIYGSVQSDSATCAATGHTFEVISKSDTLSHIKRPNLSMSQDFTITI